MAVVRSFILSGGLGGAPARVVEPELDMNRLRPRPSAAGSWMRELMRWLMPNGHAVGAPMRSIDRELEEAWPTRDL
ncbi:MAG: hypothetical protein ACREQN_14605 [Candidatus Binataceae bacterium]